jgi:superfamily I DNA/RNA helicase
MSFNPSPYQQKVFEAVDLGLFSLLIEAVAGSGKTTTLVHAVELLPENYDVLFMAFNKRIVTELQEKLPRHVNCATFNSVGYKAWLRYVGRFVKTHGNKTWFIMRDMLNKDDVDMYGAFIKRMVGLAKSAGIGGRLAPDIAETWFALMDHHNVLLQSEEANIEYGITLSQIVLRESIKQSNNIVDFDDQIYMPYIKEVSFPKYDRVFVDEGQDTNEVQIELIKRMVKPGGKVVAVGDEDQAIYGFRGADSNAMNNIRNAFSCKPYPLSITYRCAKSIVREAQKYVPKIEAFEGSQEGEVVRLENYNATDFENTDAILCRNNAPLVKMAYGFIRRGIGVNMPGRDLGEGLKNFVNKMKAKDVDDLGIKISEWLSNESARLIEKGQEDKVGVINDQVECLEVIIENLDYANSTINALLGEIDYLFKGSDSPAITLMSVHKSKGDEWSRVFILDFDNLMPSRYAKKSWQKQQENNLIYVAITRAKSYLGYISSGCFADNDSEILEKRRDEFRNNRIENSANIQNRTNIQKPQNKPTKQKIKNGINGSLRLNIVSG